MENSKTKLLLIQPHSDDILLSCSYFLLHPDEYEVEVLTVENNPKRIEEDRKLYEFLGVPFHHLEIEIDDQSYYGYHKKYKEVTVEDSYAWLREFLGGETLAEIEVQLGEFLTKFFKTHKDYTVVAPWGIGHPFHLFVRDLLEKNCSSMLYYREFPHSYKRRSAFQVDRQRQEYRNAYTFPVEEFEDIKWSLARKFYRTQSGLLFFEQANIKKQLPEEIYVKKDQELPF